MNDYVTIKEAAVLEKISYSTMKRRVVKNKVDVIVRPSQKQKGKTVTMIAVSSLSIPAQKRYLETLVESIPPHLGPLLPEEEEEIEKSPQPPSPKGEPTALRVRPAVVLPLTRMVEIIIQMDALKKEKGVLEKIIAEGGV